MKSGHRDSFLSGSKYMLLLAVLQSQHNSNNNSASLLELNGANCSWQYPWWSHSGFWLSEVRINFWRLRKKLSVFNHGTRSAQ